MYQINDLMNLSDGETRVLTENQPISDHVTRSYTSGSYDSGVGIGWNTPVSRTTHTHPRDQSNNAIQMTEIVLQRLGLFTFPTDEPEDENKENICPLRTSVRDFRASTPNRRDPRFLHLSNIAPTSSLSIQREDFDEQEESGLSTSPIISESFLSHSTLRSPGFSPIRSTPRHSPVRRGIRTRTREEAVDIVRREDLVDSSFESGSTPSHTPSPASFTPIRDDSGRGNSSEVLDNEQSPSERDVITGIADMRISTSFVTPPSRPPEVPMAPRKNKANKKSVQATGSPSFFPGVRLGLMESPAKRFMSPRKREVFAPATDSNASSMVLRSAVKPRRSTRIKRMPNRYECDNNHRAGLHNKKKR